MAPFLFDRMRGGARPGPGGDFPRVFFTMKDECHLPVLSHGLTVFFVAVYRGKDHIRKIPLDLSPRWRAVFDRAIAHARSLRMLVVICRPILRRVGAGPEVRSE